MIEVSELTKSFEGVIILNKVSFSLERGTITGIVGRNGSGKSVLFKCLCGFLIPDSGKIIINGEDVTRKHERNGEIGAIIEAPGFLEGVSGYKNLRYLSLLHDKIQKADIYQIMEKVGLHGAERKKVKKYSMGMRQRLGIAQALMEDTEILILDEPMNGLDQQGVYDMWELFRNLKGQGKVILLTSHNKEDIETLCDTVYKIDKGILQQIR